MRKDLLILIAVIAVVAMVFSYRPKPAPEPETSRPDPGCDVMLMAIGEVPEGLLDRMQAHVQGLKVVVGLPYMGVDTSMGMAGTLLDETFIMPYMEQQAENLGARKIGVTTQPLSKMDWNTFDSHDKIVFWGKRSAVISTHGMPSETELFRLLDLTLQGQGQAPTTWAELSKK